MAAYRNRPISRSHYPFARSARLGPGPKGRTLLERKDWKCRKVKTTKVEYIYECRYIGIDPRFKGKKKPIRQKRKAKQIRNKKYNRWLKAGHGPRFKNERRR